MKRAQDNPFAVHRLDRVRFRPMDCSWAELQRRLGALHYRTAIVGPKGSGKTTLLSEIGSRLQADGFHIRALRLTEAAPRFPPGFLREFCRRCSGQTIILLDGAEQLGGLRWILLRWLTLRARGLVMTTHRPGRLPTLIHCRTTAELLCEIAAEMLGQPPALLQPRAEALFAKHGGNLREALAEWYDLWADGA